VLDHDVTCCLRRSARYSSRRNPPDGVSDQGGDRLNLVRQRRVVSERLAVRDEQSGDPCGGEALTSAPHKRAMRLSDADVGAGAMGAEHA